MNVNTTISSLESLLGTCRQHLVVREGRYKTLSAVLMAGNKVRLHLKVGDRLAHLIVYKDAQAANPTLVAEENGIVCARVGHFIALSGEEIEDILRIALTLRGTDSRPAA